MATVNERGGHFCTSKNLQGNQVQWLTSINLPTQEAEIRRLMVIVQPRQKAGINPS
jgi:hypothetical protein